jgi:hypothetical protein
MMMTMIVSETNLLTLFHLETRPHHLATRSKSDINGNEYTVKGKRECGIHRYISGCITTTTNNNTGTLCNWYVPSSMLSGWVMA